MVTVGTPASVAARRRVPELPVLWSTAVAPNFWDSALTAGWCRLARIWGRLLRWKEPVWRSTRASQCCTISAKKEWARSEEHTSELQSRGHLVCRLLLEKQKTDTS